MTTHLGLWHYMHRIKYMILWIDGDFLSPFFNLQGCWETSKMQLLIGNYNSFLEFFKASHIFVTLFEVSCDFRFTCGLI